MATQVLTIRSFYQSRKRLLIYELQMSIRTWDSGKGGSIAGIMYMMMFVFAILLGIVQGGWRWNVSNIIGLWLVLGSLYTWIWGLWRRIKTNST
jgi:hypothetical protein